MKLVLALGLVFGACESLEHADQRAAQRLCALPRDAAVISWRGYPAEVGFGQREGLSLSGTFAFPSGYALGANGYRPVPWPSARTAVETRFRLGRVLDSPGWARCQTAGDNVLEASRTVSCDSVGLLNDVILCTVDPTQTQVSVIVKTAY